MVVRHKGLNDTVYIKGYLGIEICISPNGQTIILMKPFFKVENRNLEYLHMKLYITYNANYLYVISICICYNIYNIYML